MPVKVKEEVTDVYRKVSCDERARLGFSLPIPPSVNHMYIRLKRGGIRLTKVAEQYFANSVAKVNLAIDEQKWNKPERDIWLYVDLYFYMPDRRIRDSHNTIKILMDVMQSRIYINDYYVMPRVQLVEYDKENPRVEVVVRHQTKNERENIKRTKAC